MVLLNIAAVRSDALILTTDGVTVLPLPTVDPEAVIEQANTFLHALTEVHNPAASPATRSRCSPGPGRGAGLAGG